MSDIISEPIKFLGATVLSFNCQLGLGGAESSLSVDLIEDCEAGDLFSPVIGAAVYFSAGAFNFGGILTNWTYNQGSSGKTYTVRIADPRQILQNTVVIVDTYLGSPIQAINYFNAYAYWEGATLQGNCATFGESKSNESGMPYVKVIQALSQMSPVIYSPTGWPFTINFASFPANVPEYYRVAGPSVSLLQLIQDVCDVLGYEFYVQLGAGGVINIGLIDLRSPITNFGNIIAAYDGVATDLSYGQELRNEVTKTVLFGERQHYLSRVTRFNHFFGEDFIGNEYIPVVPYRYDVCGFWISKMIEPLNLSLRRPFPTNGPYTIHELDIRAAMASQEMWKARAFNSEIDGSFNQAVRNLYPEMEGIVKNLIDGALGKPPKGNVDANNPNAAMVKANNPDPNEEIEKIWSFIKNLGDTYYGKQFISPLNQLVCYYQNPESLISEKIFTDIPTNAGGWVDDGVPVLGLYDPNLSFFRENDGRIGCFALFDNSGTPAQEEDVIGKTIEDPNFTEPVLGIPQD